MRGRGGVMIINCHDVKYERIDMRTVAKVLKVGQYILEVTYKNEKVVDLCYDNLYDIAVDYKKMNLVMIRRKDDYVYKL